MMSGDQLAERAAGVVSDQGHVVELEPVEQASPSSPERQSLVLRDRASESEWSFRLVAPDRHRYRYQLTLVPKDGPRSVIPWQEDEQSVLVLVPPSAQ
jgi:hypothetical protein